MPKPKYMRHTKKNQTFQFTQRMSQDAVDALEHTFVAWCQWCCDANWFTTVKKSYCQTKRGSRWGRLMNTTFKCESCGHLVSVSSWKHHTEQLDMFEAFDIEGGR